MQRLKGLWEQRRELADWQSDLALALALVALDLLFQVIIDPADVIEFDYAGPSAVTVALALTANLPIALRRRYPGLAVAAPGVSLIVAGPLETPLLGFSLLVGVYTMAAWCSRKEALEAVAICIAGAFVALWLLDYVRYLPFTVVTLFAAWALGDRQQARRAHTESLQQRAAELERQREDQARLAVAEERARIARELHDVIAHSVSVMTVQAAAARRTVRGQPERAEEALAHIESTGRLSLFELRRLLGLVRAPDDALALAPQPGLADLEDLAAQFRGAGLPVELLVDGEPPPLAPGVELSAYRIVQEALTNALKHAGPAAVAVRVAYRADSLILQIDDDGIGPPAADASGNGSGNGLVGMQERAAVLGGSVTSGPRPGGGFRVDATLPVVTA